MEEDRSNNIISADRLAKDRNWSTTVHGKLLMLITNFGKGGAQRVFYDHATSFNKYHQVLEAVFNESEDERVYDSGLPLFSLNVNEGKNLFGKAVRVFVRASRLRKIIRKEGVGITISHMDGANWVNVLSCTSERKILVVHGTVLHDKDQNKLVQFLRKNVLLPYLYNKADVTVAVSDGIRKELTEYCKIKKVVSIPNFFDVKKIEERANEPLPKNEQVIFSGGPVLITSGRFHEQKKQDLLFQIFRNIKKEHKNSKLILLGDGELREYLIAKAGAEGFHCYTVWDGEVLSDEFDIYFLGYKENPFAYLSKSTIFLFPSAWEGFPMALSEAMVCGVPVISADCPTGPREILAPGTIDLSYQLAEPEWTKQGVLMPMYDKPGFVNSWSEVILDLLADNAKREGFSTEGRKRMQQFDKNVILAKWHQLIQSLLEGS